jgi:hypothetical protein
MLKYRNPLLPQNRRGAALLFATLMLLVLSIVGMTLVAGAVQALRMSRFQQDTSVAFNVAESGAERGVLYLRSQSSPPAGTSSFDPFGGNQTLGTGVYQVTIDPDDSNVGSVNKRYLIRSTGTVGTRREQLEVYLQLGNFGRYAYFTDYETSSVASGPIWFKGGDIIDGPAHSNNTSGSDFHINWTASNAPIFRDTVTSVANGIEYDPRQPNNETEWQRIFASGSRGFRLGVNRVELPDNTNLQRDAAWGASSGFPSSNGAFINNASSNRGIYIRGDSTMEFQVTTEGWQKIIVKQGSSTWTITIRLDSNQTILQNGSTTTTYSGTTNGVIYTTGNITSLHGKLADSYMSGSQQVRRNAFTLATDVLNGKSVTLTNDLYYKTTPNRTEAWDSTTNLRAAAMGIVSRNVMIANNAPTDLDVHAVLMAGGRTTSDGSFYVDDWDSKAIGELNLLGGIIQKKRGPVGTFSSSSGQIRSGYDKNYVYDQRMAVNPPPYFPTTGTYERLSFRSVKSGFLQ